MNPAPESISVGDYLASWLDHAQTRVRAKTHQGYESLIRCYALPRIGDICLSELTALGLQRLYGDLQREGRLSGGTVLNLHLVLTQALSQAVRSGVIASNPAACAQPPRPRRAELTALDEGIAERLLEVSRGTRFEISVAIAIATGMRRGEILAGSASGLQPDAARHPAGSGCCSFHASSRYSPAHGQPNLRNVGAAHVRGSAGVIFAEKAGVTSPFRATHGSSGRGREDPRGSRLGVIRFLLEGGGVGPSGRTHCSIGRTQLPPPTGRASTPPLRPAHLVTLLSR